MTVHLHCRYPNLRHFQCGALEVIFARTMSHGQTRKDDIATLRGKFTDARSRLKILWSAT